MARNNLPCITLNVHHTETRFKKVLDLVVTYVSYVYCVLYMNLLTYLLTYLLTELSPS
jgi:hypothetical protein